MVIGISLFHIKSGLEYKKYFPFKALPVQFSLERNK